MIKALYQTYPEINDVSFKLLTEETNILEPKTIYNISVSRNNYVKRFGYEVDKFKIESILNQHKPTACFTWLDYKAQNTINIPLGFIRCNVIKKSSQYYKEYNQDIKYYRNLFWRGDTTTHQTRTKIVNYFNNINDRNFDIAHWSPIAGKFYSDNACTEYEYDTYFNQLKSSDAFFVIRGDLPWTNSFFDCLRANTIPICVDTFYNRLGWHKIGFEISDLFLNFDLRKDSLEKIMTEIQVLLKDKEKVLYMKQNLLRFYKEFILKDKHLLEYGASLFSAGWGGIIKNKMLEIHNNNYILKDNYLF